MKTKQHRQKRNAKKKDNNLWNGNREQEDEERKTQTAISFQLGGFF